jgi:phosphohistidine phosphatase SixA
MRVPKSLLAAFAVTLLPTAGHGQLVAKQQLQGEALVRALRHGGFVLVLRHAHAPVEEPSAAAADQANPDHERQLDEQGRATAQAMGEALRSLRIPIGEIWSSPTYRARQTVALAGLPAGRIAPELGDRGQNMQAAGADQGAWLRAKVAERPRSGTNSLLITHLPNISTAFDQLAKGLGDGGALVFRPRGGVHYVLVGRIAIEDWPRLARR